ncbi:putative methyltransferase-domain-containing protein [Roridomyces roridus]|uniref:Protein-lysine N-methyltransferase EFM6 n=1 Tax=Roridomyces roridus TaxID=1738132 RepID=A0AAD7C471_9AGAR|nr:putative methyltransferase-domain-containing protein [Roridomyces roridus]
MSSPNRRTSFDSDEDPFDCLLQNEIVPEQSITAAETLELSFSNVTIQLVIDPSPGCGGRAWPAGEVLAQYLVKQGPNSLQGKNVLELGSGTGLVGLVAARLGGTVWLTDQAPLLNIMRENVALNDLSSLCTVAELNWGEAIPTEIPQPEVILLADCVYFEPAFPLLVQTLCDLVKEDTEVLFCYKKRRKADKRFFTLLKKHFKWKDVPDDPARATYSREAISLLWLSRC